MNIKKYLLFVVALCICQLANAAAYWLEIKGNGKLHTPVIIQLCYGSIDEKGQRQRDKGKELQLTGDFKIWLVGPQGKQTPLTLKLATDCWETSFTPEMEGNYRILAFNDQHPVVDRSATGGENIRPVDYLCSNYMAGKQTALNTKPLQRLDIITSKSDGFIIAEIFLDKQPVKAGTKLRVFNPDNWEKELLVGNNGQAKFYPTIKGLYIIRLDQLEQDSGEINGIKYQHTRNRCNYYLMVD